MTQEPPRHGAPPGQQPPAHQTPPPQHPPAQQPVPGAYDQAPRGHQGTGPHGTNGAAIAALILGLASVVLLFVFFPLALVTAIAAIVTGVAGRRRAARDPAAGRRGMATAGLAIGFLILVLSILLAVLLVLLFGEALEALLSGDLQQVLQDLRQQLPNPGGD